MNARRSGLFAAAAVASVFSCVSAAQARDVWVAPNGSGQGASRTQAFGSIAEAIRAARPGDVVRIARGVYEGGIWVETSGATGRPITVRAAEGPGSVVIQGGDETLNIGDGAHDLVFEDLELRNSGNNIVHVQGGSHHITLRGLVVHDAGDDGDGIKVNQAHDILIERVECYRPGARPDRPDGNPAQECIDLVDVTRAVVQDSYLHDGGNMLLYAKGASRDVVFQRNVIVGQGPDAIDPCVGLGAWTDSDLLNGRPYEAEDVVFRNNIVARCRAGAVGVYDAHRVWIVNNTLLDNGPDVIEFRAGNAPRAESRDVHVVNNIIADSGGRMRRALVRLSHNIEQLDARNNLYWNGATAVPTQGLIDPHREVGGVCSDPGIAVLPTVLSGRDACTRGASPSARGAAIDRGIVLTGPGAVSDDLLGRRRPAGRAIDLGALEFGAVTAVVTPGATSAPTAWPSQLASAAGPTPVTVTTSAARAAGRGALGAGRIASVLAVLAIATAAVVARPRLQNRRRT